MRGYLLAILGYLGGSLSGGGFPVRRKNFNQPRSFFATAISVVSADTSVLRLATSVFIAVMSGSRRSSRPMIFMCAFADARQTPRKPRMMGTPSPMTMPAASPNPNTICVSGMTGLSVLSRYLFLMDTIYELYHISIAINKPVGQAGVATCDCRATPSTE